jgi:hypothetical protein
MSGAMLARDDSRMLSGLHQRYRRGPGGLAAGRRRPREATAFALSRAPAMSPCSSRRRRTPFGSALPGQLARGCNKAEEVRASHAANGPPIPFGPTNFNSCHLLHVAATAILSGALPGQAPRPRSPTADGSCAAPSERNGRATPGQDRRCRAMRTSRNTRPLRSRAGSGENRRRPTSRKRSLPA